MKTLILGTLIGAGLVTLVGFKQTSYPVSNSENIYNESKATYDLVMRKTLDTVGEIVPAYSSKSVPAWAQTSALSTFYDATDKEIPVLTQSTTRAWTYRVPSTVVGKAWDTLTDKTVVIEVVNGPSTVKWVGVTKDGLIKRKTTAQP